MFYTPGNVLIEVRMVCRCWLVLAAQLVARDPVLSQFLTGKLNAGAVPAPSSAKNDDCMAALLRMCKELLQPGGADPMHLVQKLRLHRPALARQYGDVHEHQDWTEGLYCLLDILEGTSDQHMKEVSMRSSHRLYLHNKLGQRPCSPALR